MKQTILVVGGLAAGPSAASKAKRINPDAEVILFERGEYVSYGICEIPYYVGGTVTEFENLNPFDPSKLESSRGIKVKLGHSVEQILATKKKLLVRELDRDKLSEIAYDKLVLATGSKSREIGIEGNNAKNVFRVKTLADGIAIKEFLEEKKPRRCVIIGGGYVGMEICEALAAKRVEVTLLHIDDKPLNGLEEDTRKTVVSVLSRNGVSFRPKQNVVKFEVDATGYVRVVVTASETFDCEMVILAIGVEPNTDLASQARIRLGRHRGIVTDERQSTSIDSIFAAGDCCEIKNMVTGKWSYIPLATYASRQGRVAGENAAGGRAIFKGAIRSVAVKVFDLEVAQVGIGSLEAAEANLDATVVHISSDSKVGFFPGNETIDIIAVVEKRTGRLLGANVFGGKGSVLRADVLALAIQQKMTMQELSRVDLIYSPPFAPLWDPVLILANQAKNVIGKHN